MKAALHVFDSHYFVRALSVVLTITAWGGRNNSFCGRNNCYATAFCSNGVFSRIPRRLLPSISGGRGDDINQWVSYLEEEFNRSDGGNDGNKNNNKSDNDGILWQRRPFQTSVTTYTNAIDFLDQIDNALPNDLTVVLYFAHYCKTCQRAIVPFKQLANDNDSDKHVRFVRFETSALSPKQFLSLGIDRVPFLQIYRNGICVASFSATQKTSRTSRKIVLKPRLLEQIDACQRRSLINRSAFRDRHDGEIEANKAARIQIRESISAAQTSAGNDDTEDDEERLYRSVRTLTSESDLLRLLKVNKKVESKNSLEDIVVLMFHSHFDQSCLRAQHKFRKIASELQQQQNERHRRTSSCTMARIETSILPDKTLQSLGIERYPHIQIYWNSNSSESNNNNDDEGEAEMKECVASFSIPRSFLFARMLHESLDAIDQRTPEGWADFYKQHGKEIESQQLALEGIAHEREE